jgi:hypothetical protein
LVTRLVTASVTSPRAAPRRMDGVPAAARAVPMTIHILEWSAAEVSRGMRKSSSGLGDSATAS